MELVKFTSENTMSSIDFRSMVNEVRKQSLP